MDIEEVERILWQPMRDLMFKHYAMNLTEDFFDKICQLFEQPPLPTAEQIGSYERQKRLDAGEPEPKPDLPLTQALIDIKKAECEKPKPEEVDIVLCPCFKGEPCVIHPKPDEGRLLTAEKLTEILKDKMTLEDFISLSSYPNQEAVGRALTFAVGGQRDLTASIMEAEWTENLFCEVQDTEQRKDAECRARIERVFREIEGHPFQYFLPTWDSAAKEYDGGVKIRERNWQALKEGVK